MGRPAEVWRNSAVIRFDLIDMAPLGDRILFATGRRVAAAVWPRRADVQVEFQDRHGVGWERSLFFIEPAQEFTGLRRVPILAKQPTRGGE